jgi:hypothetical protein
MEVQQANDFVVGFLKGKDCEEVRETQERSPDFTFLSRDDVSCALEIKRLSFPLTNEEFKPWKEALMAKLPALSQGVVIRLVVEGLDILADRLAWLEENTDWVAGWITQALQGEQWASVSVSSRPGFTTNEPTGGGLVYLNFLLGSTTDVEVSCASPGRMNREDLLDGANCQLKWGKKRGMRCFFLAEVENDDQDQALGWLAGRLSNGLAHPNIDEAYAGWQDRLDATGSRWVYKQAWKRDEA